MCLFRVRRRDLFKCRVTNLVAVYKFLLVWLKIFEEIAGNGFCQVKKVEEASSKTSDDFKKSEEEGTIPLGWKKEDAIPYGWKIKDEEVKKL